MPELRTLQLAALKPLRERWIHADPLGSGKTPVGLSWLRAHETDRALIVCPSNVVRHWQRLAGTWHPDLAVSTIPKGSSVRQRAATRAEVIESAHSGAQVALVTTYAMLRQDERHLIDMGWSAVLFDEAHRLKGRNSLVHLAAAKLAHRVPLLDLSTGSPILNSAEECWSLLHLIDPRRWRSFWRWAGEHFWITITDFHGKLPRPVRMIGDPKPGALEAIAADLGELLVMRPEELMLPHIEAPEHIDYEIDMTPAERRIYDSMAKKFWAKVDGTVIFAPNEVAKITRLRQLSSDWSSALGEQEKPGSKVQAVVELIEDLAPKQVLVFVSFKATAYQLIGALNAKGIEADTYTGDDDEDEREMALAWFGDGKMRVLVATYAALAEGTDGLQHAAHHVVLLDHDWVPDIERQAIGRLLRDGQKHRVVVHHILATNTIDQVIAEAHEQKLDVVEALTGRSVRGVLTGQGVK